MGANVAEEVIPRLRVVSHAVAFVAALGAAACSWRRRRALHASGAEV